jgi:hypothetical protein
VTALLRAELLKLRTTRTFFALAGFAVLTSVGFAALVSALEEPTAETVVQDVFNSDTSGLFILVLALIGITGEWRHRTITSSLLAAPDRLRFLVAKTVAFAAAGIVLSVLIALAVTVVGVAVLSGRELPLPEASELAAQFGRNAVVAALLGAFGVGIGAVVRNPVVAIVGVLVAMFVVEPLLVALVPDVGRLGPFGMLPAAAADVSAADLGIENTTFLAPAAATAAMLAWIACAFAAGVALLRRRDVV